VSHCSDSDVSPGVGGRIRPSEGNQAGNTAPGWLWGGGCPGGAHRQAGPGRRELETGPAVTWLGQGRTSLRGAEMGSWAAGRVGEGPKGGQGQQDPVVPSKP